MTRPKSIFAGMKLTDQTPLGTGVGPDQRLFTRPEPEPAPPPEAASPATEPAEEPAPPQAAAPPQPRKVGTKEPRNLGTGDGKKAGPAAPREEPGGPFDIGIRAGHQANFLFTDEELDALDDLKRDAKRRYGLHTTKQDLVRYAVIELLNDYLAHGETSRVIEWLRGRIPKDAR